MVQWAVAMNERIAATIMQIIRDKGTINASGIRDVLKDDYDVGVEVEMIRSLLYGDLRELVVRDKDAHGYPTWRAKVGAFEASKGLEVKFYHELLRRNIISEEEAYMGYKFRNRRNGKVYDLDIAVKRGDVKLDIEIDGFEHVRADARLSIQEQIESRGDNTDIEIDWMDNRNSFIDFKRIDNKRLFRWLLTHKDWTKRYHEELLKPHDITRNIWLIENGWRIIRFWNFEMQEELERCVDDVRGTLNSDYR